MSEQLILTERRGQKGRHSMDDPEPSGKTECTDVPPC